MLAGALDEDLVIARRIRKGSADRYPRTTPPPVQAARKLAADGVQVGPVVRYVITADGPEPVRAGRPLPAGIDRPHQLDAVLAPIGDAILAGAGERFDEAIGGPKARQLALW